MLQAELEAVAILNLSVPSSATSGELVEQWLEYHRSASSRRRVDYPVLEALGQVYEELPNRGAGILCRSKVMTMYLTRMLESRMCTPASKCKLYIVILSTWTKQHFYYRLPEA